MPHPLLAAISREATFIRRRRFAKVLLESALAFSLPALCLVAIDYFSPLREGLALAGTALLAFAAFAFFLVRLIDLLTDLPNPRDVTLVVERLCPDLMDSLICAVEILERDGDADSPFAAAIIAQVEERLREQRLREVTSREAPPAILLVGLACLALVTLGMTHFSELGDKARAHLRDRLAATATGVSVSPGNATIAEGDSVIITATIHRGPTNAEIEVRDGTGNHRYNMIPQDDGSLRFEMFGVTDPFTYQVLTPTLDSAVFSVTTFPKPAIQRATITIVPPEYTGMKENVVEELRDVSAPEGSTIKIVVATNVPVTAELIPANVPPIPTKALRPKTYGATHLLADTIEYAIRLTDVQGRSVTTDRTFLIESIEDFAPVIQVESPEEDAQRRPEDDIVFAATVTDDYGVGFVEVVYSLNSGEWISRPIFQLKPNTPAQTELKPTWQPDLAGVVKNGDVIYYYFRAADNEQPTANETTTEVRFLEIRPNPDEPPENDEEEKEGGESMEDSVADLIREQKVLVRDTFSMLHFSKNEQRDELVDALARQAADLRVAAQKRLSGMQEKAESMGMSLGEIGDLFQDAVDAMVQAERRMQGRLPEESLAYQRRSLQSLIAVEIEMQKNAQKQKAKGKGKPKDQQKQKKQERDRERERLEKMEELEAAIEQIEDLARRQENLNQDMQRAATKRDPELQEFLKNRQERVREETAAMRDNMRSDAALTEAAQELSRAADAQRQAGEQLGQGQPSSAGKQGEQAAQSLDRSAQMLQQMRDGMGGNSLQQAANQLQELQEAQQGLQQQTEQAAAKGPAGRGQAQQLQEQQEQLRENLEELMENLNEATAELDKDNPQAATELAKGIQKARSENVEGNMKRAENAMKYKRLDKAAEAQEKVKEGLEQLADAIQSAQQQGPGPSAEQLTQMLQETLNNLQEIDQARRNDPGQIDPSVKEAARQAQQHAQATGDQKMAENAQQLDDAASIGGFAGTPALLEGVTAVLRQNAERLQQQIALASLRRRLELSRASGQEAPDEYRKLVDEYFRKLSREP